MVYSKLHYEHECLPCEWLFSSAIELQNHIVMHHASLICLTCNGKTFNGTDAFKSHYPFRLHKFKCGKCGVGLNGTDPQSLGKAISHLKSCQSILDRHCVKVYEDQEVYYEHCRTDREHIKIADAWEREDNIKRRQEWEEQKALREKSNSERHSGWQSYQVQIARDRSEYELLQKKEYPPFESEQTATEITTEETNTPSPIGDESPDQQYFESQGNQVEIYDSDQSNESFEYPTDWTDHATLSEEEMMSLKERMVRKNRREKRAIKAAAKIAEEERLKADKKLAREKAAEAARLEARMKLTPEELKALEEKERQDEEKMEANKEKIRAWVRERAEARREYQRLKHQSYRMDD
ncbi:hypothetical protein AOL_s00083g98 [Orbilia oligospora ATCC 24927]|uniref:C2H2-type domain-containing protein n=1 Tax=Arthrobotrys oligospora (strain ATCC 24927 / CBS 115.81 / DSM 1491) TaxID=756982 RepID=G1XGG7_ARTOA|nr:hypothetical protein AOL_s00083g98 [Orbilia oligospora ATCC 24927]EGX47590.1 hypothetical protein AOL_s00083g98 [Orbilia oligospora ATCC 24927]